MSNTNENLPAVRAGDGFNDVDDNVDTDRVIQGTILKCVDGNWSDRDGLDPPTEPLLALATATILQRWQNERPLETIVKQHGRPLPDIDKLNSKIPLDQWEMGIDNKPRPPWQRQLLVYLLDERTAEKFTFASGTIGARIAVDVLRDSVSWMRKLRGGTVYPLVKLERRPMKTRFGMKMRPDFRIVGWRGFDDTTLPMQQLEAPRQSPVEIEPDPSPAKQDPKPEKKKRSGIKSVADPTTAEQLDDFIRY